MFQKSTKLFSKAKNVLVGGVNSPVRAFHSVGGNPLFIKKGKGAFIYDVDKNKYIDYVGSYGPLILGHRHSKVVKAVIKAMYRGATFGATTKSEVKLAQLVIEAFPSIEKVRFVNSGTEAVLSALRLARGATGRNKIVKFSGCYHGHCDALLVQGGSGVMTLGMSGSLGVSEQTVENTISLPYNDTLSVQKAFEQYGKEIAAVIVEPVAGNMGTVLPQDGFLPFLRKITTENKSLLILDEVMTGFRNGFGGAQKVYNIKPDITCLGKIIGGGLPVGAYGGSRHIMDYIAPLGSVYQAGTLSGNPLAMQAGYATLSILKKETIYDALIENTRLLAEGIQKTAQEEKIAIQVNQFGSMLGVFFTDKKVYNYLTAKQTDTDRYGSFFWGLIKRGVFLPPSAFETWFVSMAHKPKYIHRTLDKVQEVFRSLQD